MKGILVLGIVLAVVLVGSVSATATPSTNDVNRDNGWAHVNLVDADFDSVTLQFVSTRAFWSCFEYRSDNEPNTVVGANPNPAITDGRWTQVCVNNFKTNVTISAIEFVDVRMVYGAEKDERFDWTRFDVLPEPGMIISPVAGQEVPGGEELNLEAKDVGAKNGGVQWAIRKDTCAANTGTIAGNVDGYNTAYTWNQGVFLSSLETQGLEFGEYCFVFNPRDGDRLTQLFSIINPDLDNDGVLNDVDFCDGTVADAPMSKLGTNRHVWNGTEFVTLVPAGRGKFNTVSSEFSIEDTYGCSCEEILDQMTEKTGFDFEGHYKHGCSKSVIEAWIAGEYYVGPTLVETVEVPSTSSTDTMSTSTLDLGKDYFLRASGTAFACNQPGCVIEFDAEYSTSDATIWVDGVAAPYDGLGLDLLDLKVDGNFVDWGAYSATHVYEIPYPGTGEMLALLVYDIHYPSNSGSLFVDIIEDKWVDLW